jgi:ankyrin repeat protein
MLFAAGADVNYVSGSGKRRMTALTAAAKLNATKAFDALLKAGADPSNEANYVALCYGANSNNMHIVCIMLTAGAPIDYTVGESIIALGRAVMQRHTKMVKYLLEQGADMSKAVTLKGTGITRTALEYACLQSHVWSAAENKFVDKPVTVDTLKHLLAVGADVTATNASGATALHNLMRAPTAPIEAVQLVIQHDADINATDQTGRTPLLLCLNEHTNTVLPLQHIAALISAGADCSLVSNEGVAPLQWTALWPDGKILLLKLLLQGGADVTYADPYDGQTALFRAVTGGCVEAVQLLLAAGSAVHHRDPQT